MACQGPTPEEVFRYEVDAATRAACEAIKQLTEHQIPLGSYALHWWTDHQERDRAREKREAAAEEQRQARTMSPDIAAVLDELSPRQVREFLEMAKTATVKLAT